jgi:hypothetical protein
MGASAGINQLQAGQLSGDIALQKKSISEVQMAVVKGEHTADDNIPTGLAAVARFQAFADDAAATDNCSMDEFKASSDIAPFISSFKKDGSIPGWGQVRVDLTLHGSAQDVMEALRKFHDVNVPIEFDHVELRRTAADAVGKANVTADLELRVLTAQGKA